MEHRTNERIKEFLSLIGLEKRETRVYEVLLERGIATTLEISKKTNIARTTIYRVIESLKRKGIVDEVVEEHVTKVQAAPFSRLKMIVDKRKEETEKLDSLLPQIQQLITREHFSSQPDTKIIMYRGREGIRQMVWNVLSAKTEVIGYTHRVLSPFVGRKFMNRWREEFRTRIKKGRDILTDEYLESIHGEDPDVDWGHWETRKIGKDILTIDHQMDIYNDVVTIYNWHEGEVFGVEIHNKKVARMQRQIFDIVWEKAELIGVSSTKVEFTDRFIRKESGL